MEAYQKNPTAENRKKLDDAKAVAEKAGKAALEARAKGEHIDLESLSAEGKIAPAEAPKAPPAEKRGVIIKETGSKGGRKNQDLRERNH